MRFLFNLIFGLLEHVPKPVGFLFSRNLLFLPLFFTANIFIFYLYSPTREDFSNVPSVIFASFFFICSLVAYFLWKDNPTLLTSPMFGYPKRKSSGEEKFEVQQMWGKRSGPVKAIGFVVLLGTLFGFLTILILDAGVVTNIIIDLF